MLFLKFVFYILRMVREKVRERRRRQRRRWTQRSCVVRPLGSAETWSKMSWKCWRRWRVE